MITLEDIDDFVRDGAYLSDPLAPDACVVSYPRSGRTWLRYLVNYIQLRIRKTNNKGIVFKHDGMLIHRPEYMERYISTKYCYSDRRVLLLVRDPRDVVVSAYNWVKYAWEKDWIRGVSIGKYMRSRYGMKNIVRFMNDWAHSRNIPKEFVMFRYLDMVRKGRTTLRAMFKFLTGIEVPDAILDEALDACRFDRMHAHLQKYKDMAESRQVRANGHLARRGVVGGYVDYLSPEEIAWMDSYIDRHLDSYYNFYKTKVPRPAGPAEVA